MFLLKLCVCSAPAIFPPAIKISAVFLNKQESWLRLALIIFAKIFSFLFGFLMSICQNCTDMHISKSTLGTAPLQKLQQEPKETNIILNHCEKTTFLNSYNTIFVTHAGPIKRNTSYPDPGLGRPDHIPSFEKRNIEVGATNRYDFFLIIVLEITCHRYMYHLYCKCDFERSFCGGPVLLCVPPLHLSHGGFEHM